MRLESIFSRIVLHSFALLLALILIPGCNNNEDEYRSPAPGIAQVNLHAKYNNFDTVFATNNFAIKVTQVKAVRSDGIRANIFGDKKATGRLLDVYNALSEAAYDSSLIIGEYPLPPGTYTGLELLIEPDQGVILDGYRYINVVRPIPYSATVNVSTTFRIDENRTTLIVLSVDLDSTLVRRAYDFEYRPYYYVSSVITY